MKRHIFKALFAASALFSALAVQAQDTISQPWVNSEITTWKNPLGQCWHAGQWRPALARETCGGGETVAALPGLSKVLVTEQDMTSQRARLRTLAQMNTNQARSNGGHGVYAQQSRATDVEEDDE